MNIRMNTKLALSILALSSVPVLAHEYWIEPTTFRPLVNSTVGVQLFVGDGFPGEARPRDPNKLVRLFAFGPKGEFDIPGEDGGNPAGHFACEHSGVYVIGYRSNTTSLKLDAKKFEEYLEDEGLRHVIEARAKSGETNKEGREHYSRAAKCLIRTTSAKSDTKAISLPADSTEVEMSLAFPAEVTPKGIDPTTAHPGTELTFLVTHDGKPAGNVLVMAFCKEQAGHIVKAQTDEAGLVRVTPDRAGTWMVSNVFMKRAESNSDADWASVWASLTFEITPKTEAEAQKRAAANPQTDADGTSSQPK